MKSLYYCLIIIILASCKKKEIITPASDSPMSIIPYIELKNVTPTTVKQFKDSIVFTVYYEDGDGNIGFEESDSLSLYLTDSRISLTEKFHIPPQSPDSTTVAIQGYLSVILKHTFLLDTAGTSPETTTYTIQLKDRNSNWSNTVTSATVTINP